MKYRIEPLHGIGVSHCATRGQVEAQGVSELKSFVQGLKKDYDAVKAGLTLEWSQGPVEGHVHRLKLLKRQMYGRAGFQTLRKRVLQCS